MLELINDERRRHALGPVILSALHNRQAKEHAKTMGVARQLSHSDPGTYGGECVGYGAPNWRSQFEAWMGSPYYANIILNPNWVHAGFGEMNNYRVLQFS